MRGRFGGALLAALLCAGLARADVQGGAVEIGVLTDKPAMLAHRAEPGSIIAAQGAMADFGGTAFHPLGTADFATDLLNAPAPGAQVIGLATTQTIPGAHAFRSFAESDCPYAT